MTAEDRGDPGGKRMKGSVSVILILAFVLVGSMAPPLATAALAGELSGVTLPDSLRAGDKTLKLNGLGLRKKAVFKVYVGGLYLESPSKDAGAILAADRAKAIRMHFLRDLTKAQLVEAFQEGFEANVKDRAPQMPAFDRMLALVPDVKEGGTLTFTYLPGKGTTLSAGSQELGVFEGKGFADAVFAIWLGPKPPSEDLKKGLLG
jgi:Chalcone isomerase-like